jgi:hypothetical protein
MKRFETIRSSCRYVDGTRLWFGKAALTASAVRISGWHGFTRYSRRVLLDDLQSVSRRPETPRSNIAFRLVDNSIWSAEVSAPGLWRIEAAQRIRSINPDRIGDGDEVVMTVSSWPSVVERPVVAEPIVPEQVVEAPVVSEPIVPERAEEWLEGPPPVKTTEVPLADTEFLGPAMAPYSLTEAYSAASGIDDDEEEDVEPPKSEHAAVLVDRDSDIGSENAPDWRPIRLIVSGKRVGSDWQRLHDMGSTGRGRI